jgi:hypothetical protein
MGDGPRFVTGARSCCLLGVGPCRSLKTSQQLEERKLDSPHSESDSSGPRRWRIRIQRFIEERERKRERERERERERQGGLQSFKRFPLQVLLSEKFCVWRGGLVCCCLKQSGTNQRVRLKDRITGAAAPVFGGLEGFQSGSGAGGGPQDLRFALQLCVLEGFRV